MAVRLEATPPQATARRRFRYTLPGAWLALVFACLALTPSLLPRGALLQGVVCGITAAIGYGAGVVGAWTWRAFADRDPRPPRPGAWRVFAISAAALLVVALGLGLWWQAQLRDLMGAPAPNPLLLPLLARALGWVAVVAGTWLVASGLLLNGLAALATAASRSATPPPPRASSGPPAGCGRRPGVAGVLGVAGSPGTEHRRHRAVGRGHRRMERVRGAGADPGLRRHPLGTDVEERAELAVADLERAGGFDRANLLVATTTGSGWLDPGAVDSFEYLTGGDSATVAMQYSYLPSWLSYLVDQKKAREAGRQLFDAVYDRAVRFTNDVATGVAPASAAWEGTRILYLQHPSDPIVWWGPALAWDRPDWLGEPRGRDVLGAMTWIPLVTFWQVTVDLPLAAGVPDGHGHLYTREFVDGWAAVLDTSGLTADEAERLRDLVTASG
jgi:uncharacterized membrane protein